MKLYLKFILIIFLLVKGKSFSQEKRFESVYQECIYSNMPNNGERLKRYINEFENYLISSNILESSSGKSYLKLFKSLTEGKKTPYIYRYNYLDSINKLKINILPKNKKCFDFAMKDESFVPFFKRFFVEGEYEEHKKVNFDIDFSEALRKTYKEMKETDYKLDYYKHSFFMILYTVNEI